MAELEADNDDVTMTHLEDDSATMSDSTAESDVDSQLTPLGSGGDFDPTDYGPHRSSHIFSFPTLGMDLPRQPLAPNGNPGICLVGCTSYIPLIIPWDVLWAAPRELPGNARFHAQLKTKSATMNS